MSNRKKLELSPRLRQLADWVPPGTRVADIGTDHAYLPVWLLLEGRVPSAIAGDLRRGPLARARETGRTYQVEDRIDFRLCDGLSAVGPEEAETIVVAGMGGENIAAILSAAPWTAGGHHTLLLQPMTRAEELRSFLTAHGYAIRREALVRENHRTLYPVIEARGGGQTLTAGQLYGGYAVERDPLGDSYLIEQILRLQGAVAGLNRTGAQADQERADALRDRIAALLALREEWRHAHGSGH